MDHAIPSVAAFDRRSARAATAPRRLNWGLILAVGVNCTMWAAIFALVEHLKA